MKYRIVSDSSSNIYEMNGVSYACAPLKIVAGDTTFVDTKDLDVTKMLEALKAHKGPSSTSCPNCADWLEAFGDADIVVGTCITSNLSGSYNAAMAAKEEYEAAHPGAKVFILDSLSAGPELQLFLEKFLDAVKAEKSYEEIKQELTNYAARTHLVFSLESLSNLVKNGRVSPAVAAVAGILGVRVVGKASDEGTLQPLHKCRGEKKAILTMVKEMKEHGFKGGKVRISHCFNENIANSIKELVLADYPNSDIGIVSCSGLCSYYAEKGGVLVGFEG